MPLSETPSLSKSITVGAIGFAAVSLCVFATVAFGERWMYARLGLMGAYLTWTALFILLSGAVFGSIVRGQWRLPRFYLLNGAAFLAYALAWCSAYFILRGPVGEWVGSLAGAFSMALVFAIGFSVVRTTMMLFLVLFVTHSIGYFLGSALNNHFGGPAGMLLWGLSYGVFFGAGIGATLYFVQRARNQ